MGFCIVYMVWMVISSPSILLHQSEGDSMMIRCWSTYWISFILGAGYIWYLTHIFHIDSSSHFRPQIHFMNIISAHRGINLISCTHIYIHIWSNLTVLQIMSWTWDWLVIFYQKHLNPYLNHTILVKTKMRILVWKTEEGLVKNIIL